MTGLILLAIPKYTASNNSLPAIMCCERYLSVSAGIQSLTGTLLFGITARPWILDLANEEQ